MYWHNLTKQFIVIFNNLSSPTTVHKHTVQQQQIFNKLEVNTKQVIHPHLAYAIPGGGLSTQSYKSNYISNFNYITELTVTYTVE